MILILILDGDTGQVTTVGQVTTQDQVTTQGLATFAGQVTTLGRATFAGRVTIPGLVTAQDGARQMTITFRGSHQALFYSHQCPMVDPHPRMVDIECQDIQDIA